jgi:uncharacterized protein YjbK
MLKGTLMSKEGSAEGKESEIKYCFESEAQLQAVADAADGQPGSALRQINHFFDTEDLALNNAKYTLRLREEAGNYVLGAKGPERKSEDGTLTEKPEEERRIEESDAREMLKGSKSPLGVLEAILSADVALLRAIRHWSGQGSSSMSDSSRTLALQLRSA